VKETTVRSAAALLTTISFGGAGGVLRVAVRPVLAKNCYSCHAADQQFSGLRVDSREALLKGGSANSADAGSPAESLLVRAIRHESGVAAMPMGNKLKADEIAAVEEWIKAGAVWPASAKPATADWYERAAKTHWSFQPVKNPAPPAVRNTAWPRNEIDRFILAALEAKGLTPARQPTTGARAPHQSLLTGLPSWWRR
jgi:mono/diheme cytochrome c family protein